MHLQSAINTSTNCLFSQMETPSFLYLLNKREDRTLAWHWINLSLHISRGSCGDKVSNSLPLALSLSISPSSLSILLFFSPTAINSNRVWAGCLSCAHPDRLTSVFYSTRLYCNYITARWYQGCLCQGDAMWENTCVFTTTSNRWRCKRSSTADTVSWINLGAFRQNGGPCIRAGFIRRLDGDVGWNGKGSGALKKQVFYHRRKTSCMASLHRMMQIDLS